MLRERCFALQAGLLPLTCSCSRRRRVLFMPRRARREGSAAQAARPRPCSPWAHARAAARATRQPQGFCWRRTRKYNMCLLHTYNMCLLHTYAGQTREERCSRCAGTCGAETLGGTSCLKCLRKSRAQFTVTSSPQQPTITCCVGGLQADPDQQALEGCCCAEWDACGGPERRGSRPHGARVQRL